MPDEMRPNRPMVNRPDMVSGHVPMDSHGGRRGSKTPWLILALVVIVLVVLGVLFRDKLFMKDGTTASKSGYQAVFLTNGQVYFGKISQKESDYVKLTDIFYLQQVSQPVQGSQQDQQQAQTKLSLVKLGQELHGPVDEMYINRSQILFFEDMKTEGQVVQAIIKYKKDPTAATSSPATDQTPTQQTPATQSQVPQTQTPVKTPTK